VSGRLEEIHTLTFRNGAICSGRAGASAAVKGKWSRAAVHRWCRALLLDEWFQGLAPALALDYARTWDELRKHPPRTGAAHRRIHARAA
jgi:branched-chain amino acid transport system ATP-binding protein